MFSVLFWPAELFSVPDVIFPLAKIVKLDFFGEYLDILGLRSSFQWAQLGQRATGESVFLGLIKK